MGAKFGIAACFNLVYVANQHLFPLIAVATSFGVCNVVSRIVTIFAPDVAEMKPETISMWSFIIMAGLALGSIIFL